MTDVWCDDKSCMHNEIGRCTLDSIGLKHDPDIGLYCNTYSNAAFEHMLDDYYPHGDR